MSESDSRPVLLRILQRKTSLEPGVDDATIRQLEFEDDDGTLDLRPSVYAISDVESVRAATEHAAGCGLDVKNLSHLDLAGALTADVVQSPGNDWFTFANERHHELMLDEGSVNELVRHARVPIG